LSLFKQADLDGNATLEEKEFSRFISMVYPGDVWWMDLSAFFKAVDVDGSGAISLEEFLGWAYSIPSTTNHGGKLNSNERPLSRMSSSPALSGANTIATDRPHTVDPSSPTSRRSATPTSPKSPSSPLSPTSPGSRSQRRLRAAGEQLIGSGIGQEPIVLEIHCSHCFAEGSQLDQSKLKILDHMIKERTKGTVKIKKVVEPAGANLKGVLTVTALLGTGIRLWDKGPMIAFREDPFTSHESMQQWTKNLAKIHVPLLFRIMTR
jgi:hypothetical protein